MESLRLTKDGFRAVRQKMILRSVPLLALAVLAGLYPSLQNQQDNTSSLSNMVVLILLLAFALLWVVYRAIRIQHALWDTYELELDTNHVVKMQGDSQVAISKAEVTEIFETDEGEIFIRTSDKYKFIDIPVAIEKREWLKQVISAWKPIQHYSPKSIMDRYPLVLPVVATAALGIFYTSRTPGVVISTGLLLVAVLIWAFVEIRRSRQASRWIRVSAFLLLLPVITALFKIIEALRILLSS